MSLPTFIVPFSESKEFTQTLVPKGTHFARIYKIIDLGTHEDIYLGVVKGSKRIFKIYFEFPKIKHVFKEELGEQPLVISKEFKVSFTSKDSPTFSALTKLVNATGANGHDKNYNLFDLLTKTTQLKIEHKQSEKDGKTYANITDFSQLSDEQKEIIRLKPELYNQINKTSYLYLNQEYFDYSEFEKQPDFIKEKIQESPEFKNLKKGLEEDLHEIDISKIDIPF